VAAVALLPAERRAPNAFALLLAIAYYVVSYPPFCAGAGACKAGAAAAGLDGHLPASLCCVDRN
jgi:hypothetical protein